jgi:hypothetical protein
MLIVASNALPHIKLLLHAITERYEIYLTSYLKVTNTEAIDRRDIMLYEVP